METADGSMPVFDYEKFKLIRERSIGRLVWRMKRHLDATIEPQLHARGYTDFKMSYLMFLANIDQNGTTNNELAKLAGITKQAMSKIASSLEEAGYVYTQPHAKDARATLLFLNERGKALFQDMKVVVESVYQNFEGIIGHERLENFIETMLDILKTVENQKVNE